jgi:hypothetical protein
MYPLQGPPGENEYGSPEAPRENQNAAVIRVARFVGLAYLVFIIGWLWSDETVRLYTLHKLISLLQRSARTLGTWALSAEKEYYELVNVLH